MKKSDLNRTKDYYELVAFAKAYFIKYKIKSSCNSMEIVHNIILEYPNLKLEEQIKLFTKFYNAEEIQIHRIRMCEKDMEKEQVAVRDNQREYLKDDKHRLKHNEANKKLLHDKRIDDHKWAHKRDVANAVYQKVRYKNNEAYRLKKNEKDRKYYAVHHPKLVKTEEIPAIQPRQ